MFASTKKENEKEKPMLKKIDFTYKNFGPGKIKQIVVFDGGPRTIKFSKTSFMVNNFIK